MITITFAGNESGDVSFNFGKGASRYFVMSVIATARPEELRQSLADVRKEFGLSPSHEFSFNSISSSQMYHRIFQSLQHSEFDAWALVVDKTILPDFFRAMRRLDFYLFCITELLQSIPSELREKVTLILDEFGGEPSLPLEFRRYMKRREIPRRFSRVLTKRSKSEPLIQIADLAAGSVLRRDSQNDSEAFDMIAGKFRKVTEYHP